MIFGTRYLIRIFTDTDILYKPDDAPERPEGVVGVHDRVDHEVHDHKPPGGRGVLTERVPAVDEDSDVVIPVQEYKLLLPEHNEDRVTQLRNLTTRFYYEETIFYGRAVKSTFDRTNIQVQNPLTLSFSMKLGMQSEW